MQASIQKRNEELRIERVQGNQMREKMAQELLFEKQKLKEKMSTFKRQQNEQLELNKKLRDEQLQKETELDNKPPSGQDLMYALY